MAAGVKWLDYGLETRGPGQWDEMNGVLEGYWANPYAAREALKGKKMTVPGQGAGAYGFYIGDGSLRTSWARGGRVRAEFTAPGALERKVKAVKCALPEQYSLSDVVVGTPAPVGLTATTYERLQFRATKRGYDVSVVWAPGGTDLLELENAGKKITSHWAATLAGVSLATEPVSPFTAGTHITAHYPSGWFYDIEPGDSVGGGKLLLAVFRFRHQWFWTL